MSLDEIAARGHVVDMWEHWMQGWCLDYAVALTRVDPALKFGTFGFKEDENSFLIQHHFAHDATHAYDSAGRHPLPYVGILPNGNYRDPSAEWFCWTEDTAMGYEVPDETEIERAVAHIERHGILKH